MIDASDLQSLAKSIALGVYGNAEDAAFKQLTHVFEMGRMKGKAEAYQANREASQRRLERLQEKRSEHANG